MLLSRFWYVVMAVALGAVTFALYLSTSMYDRASVRAMGEALAGDSQVVASFLRDDARKRATSLIVPALDEDIRTHLAKSSDSPEKIPNDSQEKVRTALQEAVQRHPGRAEVRRHLRGRPGRTRGRASRLRSGERHREFRARRLPRRRRRPARLDSRRFVGARRTHLPRRRPSGRERRHARRPPAPSSASASSTTASRASSPKRTGAAIGFYANGARISSGAPEGFDTAQLDTITSDLKGLDGDPSYKDKGFSDVRTIHDDLGVVYARLVGEAWDIGAGYAVARTAHLIGSPLGFLRNADDKDKRAVPLTLILIASLLFAVVGLAIQRSSSTRARFSSSASRPSASARERTDQLTPSKFRGVYRQIASNLNDGMEKVAAKGGAPRRAADLDAVLGPMPAQPSMSAFSLPQDALVRTAAHRCRRPRRCPPSHHRSPGWVGPRRAPPSAAPLPSLRLRWVLPRRSPAPGPAAAHPPAPPAPPKPKPKPPSPTLLGVAPASPAPATAAIAEADPRCRKARQCPRTGPLNRGARLPPPVLRDHRADEDEATVVSQVPNEILGQLAANRDTGRPPPIEDEAAEWKKRLRRVRAPQKRVRRADRRPQLREVQEHAAQKPRPAAPASRV